MILEKVKCYPAIEMAGHSFGIEVNKPQIQYGQNNDYQR